MDVIERIIQLKDKKGYSTNKLANLAGLTQSTLQSILSNRNLPTIPTLEKICDALDISLSSFFNTTDAASEIKEGQEHCYCCGSEPIVLTPELKELIESARDLSPEQISQLTLFIKTMINHP